jgi:uncharacterized protein (TIGR02757 family)
MEGRSQSIMTLQPPTRSELDALYDRINRLRYVHPDPVEFLYAYRQVRDREIVGFVAASLAYGRVLQILKSVSRVLAPMGASPFEFLEKTSESSIRRSIKGFKHRFATADDLGCMLMGIKRTIGQYGSLLACFLAEYDQEHETVLPALKAFASAVCSLCGGRPGHLIALPERGSACKRLNLFMRWMVRQDEVDPGGWHPVSPSKLIVPIDTHMHRFALSCGMTGRKQANMLTAMEVTRGFKKIIPEDPVKYDFALTRYGIRTNAGLEAASSRRHPLV